MQDSSAFNIRSARVKAGFSQEQMANKLKMSRQTYREYENGKMVFRVDKAWEFSCLCNIPFKQIIFFEDNYTSSVVMKRKEQLECTK